MGVDVKITSHREECLKKISTHLKQGMTQACLLVERDANTNCPVDTGRLRASITNRLDVEGSELVGVVGTNVFYAPFVELGLKTKPNYPPQPFLFPALESNKKKIIDLLKDK